MRVVKYFHNELEKKVPGLSNHSLSGLNADFINFTATQPHCLDYKVQLPDVPVSPVSLMEIRLEMYGRKMPGEDYRNLEKGVDQLVDKLRHYQEKVRELEAKGYEGHFTIRDDEPFLRTTYSILVGSEGEILRTLDNFLLPGK